MLALLNKFVVVLVVFLNACAATMKCENERMLISRKTENQVSVSIKGSIQRVKYSKKEFPNGLTCGMLKGDRELAKRVRFSVGDYRKSLSGSDFAISDTSVANIDSVKLVDDEMGALIWIKVKTAGTATLRVFLKGQVYSEDLPIQSSEAP